MLIMRRVFRGNPSRLDRSEFAGFLRRQRNGDREAGLRGSPGLCRYCEPSRNSAKITVTAKDDTIAEPNETVVLTLVPPDSDAQPTDPAQYVIDPEHGSAERSLLIMIPGHWLAFRPGAHTTSQSRLPHRARPV